MTPLAAAAAAVHARPAAGALLMLGAGIATSLGPCVAARYVAVSALANASRRPVRTVAAYVSGMACAYAALAASAALWQRVTANAGIFNALIGGALAIAGIVAIVRARPHHETRSGGCSGAHVSHGGAFVAGAAASLVMSPCCAPVIAMVAAAVVSSGDGARAAWLLMWFAAGHGALLGLAGVTSGAFARRVASIAGAQAPALVGGTLMLALGAYYAVLA